jgi:hypothetical protein
MRSLLVATLFTAAVLAAVAHSGSTPPFMCGISSANLDSTAITQLQDVAATHVRRYVFWNSVEPELAALNSSLSIPAMKADPQRWIYDWSAHLDWSYAEQQIRPLLAANITPVVEIGEGTFYGLPLYKGELADPAVIGNELYLAYQYRFARAAVHRYKDVISLWQIENELNEAFLSTFYGQRLNKVFPLSPWANWTFLTTLLSTLRDAVKDEDTSGRSQVTMNFHTDVPLLIHKQISFLTSINGYYLNAVEQWHSLLDIISIDAYPNMYAATPIAGINVSQRVAAVLAVLKRVGDNSKSVFVMETGYPTDAVENSSYPSAVNFSQSSQAVYVAEVIEEVHRVGGSGLFYFKFVPSPGMTPPAGGYSAADVSMFEAMQRFLWSSNETQLLEWVLEPGDIQEVLGRAGYFLHQPHVGWGTMNEDGSLRPSYDALKKHFSSLCGKKA